MATKLINNNNNKIDLKRDSFSGRICDDLCEVLLSYLSFEDKIHFECVSKQFEKCIYIKQNTIEINESRLQTKNGLNKLLIGFEKNLIFDYKAFESVLKKLKFINNIIIDFNNYNDIINTKVIIEIIIENCNNLKSIAFNFLQINRYLIEEFGLTFGQKLTEIDFIGAQNAFYEFNKYKKLLSTAKKIRSYFTL
jgi:hypothetical protein